MSLPTIHAYKPGAVLEPGIWTGVPTAMYHTGPAPAPELSSSVLQALLAGSPLHAWAAHSRLNPNAEREDARNMEIGSVAHKLVLGAGADIVVLDFKDYRTNAAKAARDEATALGKIPCLACDFVRAEELSVGLAVAAEAFMGMPISKCLREVVLLWRNPKTGCWRKAMLDICTPDLLRWADLKTTQASVAPDPCAKRIYDGYHVQAAFYRSGLDALHPEGRGRRSFGFIFGETSAPFAVSAPIDLTPGGWELAQQQVDVGSALWDSCLKLDRWPAFDQDPQQAEPPPYVVAGWLARMNGDHTLNPLVE